MDIVTDNMRHGVGMVVINDQGKIFAGKRMSINSRMVSFFLKRPWQMPQGGIEPNETPYEAALRELREEIGTDNMKLLAESKNWLEYTLPPKLRRNNGELVIGQRQKWFLFAFNGNNNEFNLNTTNHSEFDTWRWMTPGNVIRLSVHFKHELYLAIFHEFRPYIDRYVALNRKVNEA